MADFTLVGYYIQSQIVNDGNNISVIIDEYQPPYTHTKTGEKVEGCMDRWHILFKSYHIKFIRSNFKYGMLVKIKGTMRPVGDKNFSLYGETINLHTNSKNLTKEDKRVLVSQKNIQDLPNIEDYLKEDF